MPAKRSNRPAASTAARPKVADDRTPEESPTPASDAVPAVDSPADEAVPLNRAERRRRGKGGAPQPPYGKGKVTGSKGPAPAPRLWANRRGGG